MLNEDMPLGFETKYQKVFDEGIPLLNSTGLTNRKVQKQRAYRRTTLGYKPRIMSLVTAMTLTCLHASTASATVSANFIVSPTIVKWHQPLNITITFDKTCTDDLQWLQVSDELTDNIIARNNVSYNKLVYEPYLETNGTFIKYTLGILNVTFQDLQVEYRAECGTHSTSIRALESDDLFVKPERLSKSLVLKDHTMNGTVYLFNVYPVPTRYQLEVQIPGGHQMTFNRNIHNGSIAKVLDLANVTLHVKEPLPKNICSADVYFTLFVGNRPITTFVDHISMECRAEKESESLKVTFIIILLTVLNVIVIGVIALVYKLRHKCQPCVTLMQIPFACMTQRYTDKTDDDDVKEKWDVMVPLTDL